MKVQNPQEFIIKIIIHSNKYFAVFYKGFVSISNTEIPRNIKQKSTQQLLQNNSKLQKEMKLENPHELKLL